MTKQKTSALYLACAIAAAVIWGFFAFPLRHIKQYSPQQILYYRIFTSFAIVWAINLMFRKKQLQADYQLVKAMGSKERRRILLLFLASGIFITFNWYTFIHVVNHVSLKAASFAYMVCPILTAAGGFLILKEQVTRLKLIAIAIAILSVGILSTASVSQAMWSVVIAATYALYLILQKVLNRFDKLNLLGINLLISTLILLPFYFHDAKPVPAEVDFWAMILIIAVLMTIVPLFLSSYALNGIPSSTLGITIYVNPAISFTVAIVAFGEHVTLQQIGGYLLLIVAVIIFNWPVISSLFGPKDPGTDNIKPIPQH
ncbi:EamA family transporter [Mucilaginibacter myungsuensis]|uniref:EamA family transporter n=1 Tax=Mucilaginibacter myungsuensis TaxID=649104 RepID=A0A929KVG0_9SPHI|nr:EamA family transporter [Mucilaginibacter myungsuensis]MBE9662334.1 EamA family transporter [Mucilaginibacter myungsuensis]MDN3599229.1 EamA family transporter [Mucilaginibacter myungsuensis]